MRHRITRLLAMLLCVALLPVTGCQEDSPYDKGFRIPLSGEPYQLDPQVCGDEASRTVVLSLFEGLTRLNEEGQVVAGAAASWTLSDDRLTYTFQIGDSRWSDGEPVTAADFVYGIRRAVDAVTDSPLAELTFGIVGAEDVRNGKQPADALGVTAKDDRTLEIRLKKADDDFLYKLAFVPFMPCREDFFLSTNARYGLEPEYLVTNGAFTLDNWDHGTSLLLLRNEHYSRRKEIFPERVRFMVTLDGSVPDNIKNGTLDIGEIAAEERVAAEDAGAKIVTLRDSIQYLWFNTRLPSLSQTAVRTALRDSIEWEGLPAFLDGLGQTAATGYVTPEATLRNGEIYRTERNAIGFVSGGKDMAARLDQGLAAAGIKSMPTLTVLCAEDTASVELSQYVIQCWQKHLGLYFRLEPVSVGTLSARVEAGDFQIAVCPAAAPGSTALQALTAFTSDSDANITGFANAAYDQLAAQTDGGDRAAVEKLERALTAACPAVPLGFVCSYYAVAGNTEGIVIHAFDGGVFKTRFDFSRALKYED